MGPFSDCFFGSKTALEGFSRREKEITSFLLDGAVRKLVKLNYTARRNSMDFYQWCTLAAVVAFVVLVIFAVRAILQITRTAQAVEYLAVTTAENVEKTKSTFELMDNISSFLDSGFYKAVRLGIDFVNKIRK